MPSTDSCFIRDLPLVIYSRMEMAKRKDSVESVWLHVRLACVFFNPHLTLLHQKSVEGRGPTMTINFVFLQSPLLASRDPDTVIVSREH